jgi:hypothetical protein
LSTLLGLLRNSGVYVQKLVERVEKVLGAALDAETYAPLELKDVLDYEKYVEKYGLQVEDLGHDYPVYLPYTSLVVQTNDEIKRVFLPTSSKV